VWIDRWIEEFDLAPDSSLPLLFKFLETAERLNDFMRVSLCEVYFFLGSKGIQVEEPIVYLKLLDIDPSTISKEVLRVLSNLDVSHESDSSDNKNSISRKLMETRIKSLFLKQIDPNSSRRLCRPLFRNPTYSR
jgi:hypothetical protein